MDKLTTINQSIVKTEEQIKEAKLKLMNLKAEKVKLEYEKLIKILNDNKIDEEKLLLAIELFKERLSPDVNNTEKQDIDEPKEILNENN